MDLQIIEILAKIDIINLLAIAGLLFFFNARIDRKFDKVDGKFDKADAKSEDLARRTDAKIDDLARRTDAKIDDLARSIEKIDEKITDIDRRLCRLEGAFTAKECCRIQDERNLKKAE